VTTAETDPRCHASIYTRNAEPEWSDTVRDASVKSEARMVKVVRYGMGTYTPYHHTISEVWERHSGCICYGS